MTDRINEPKLIASIRTGRPIDLRDEFIKNLDIHEDSNGSTVVSFGDHVMLEPEGVIEPDGSIKITGFGLVRKED